MRSGREFPFDGAWNKLKRNPRCFFAIGIMLEVLVWMVLLSNHELLPRRAPLFVHLHFILMWVACELYLWAGKRRKLNRYFHLIRIIFVLGLMRHWVIHQAAVADV